MDQFVQSMREKVGRYSFSCRNEFDMQFQFGEFLHEEDYSFGAEVWLTKKDRVDFTVNIPGGIVAIEAKIKPPTIGHLRQLARYAIPTVKALVLLSIRPMVVPTVLAGRPCYNIALWSNLL